MEFESLRELMKSARSVRRFQEDREVSRETLERLVELVRYCPSGRNAQSLRYIAVTSAEDREKLFPLLKWAGYFPEWDGPEPGERPAAYLIQCIDTHFGSNCLCDDGLQLEALTLGARTLGLAGCIIKAFNAPKVSEAFMPDSRYVPCYVMALGYPVEQVVIEDMPEGDDADFKYYRTADGVHHVPKRPLDEFMLNQ
ncbi:MAG: nitroreductase family protein [Bacteroides sp.]|nr:nitroreductase family protein [Bacteroides sp.]